MIDNTKAEYKEWFDEFSWEEDKCALKNKNYGEYLASYISNQQQELVLNLNASWGSGKTHFLKQLYTHLLNGNNNPDRDAQATVYINAWSSDFTNDPLLVLVTELVEQLHKIHEGYDKLSDNLYKNFGEYSKKAWNFAVSAGTGFIVNQTDIDGSAALGVAENFKVGEDKPSIGKSLSEGYKMQSKAIKDTRNCLEQYAEQLQDVDSPNSRKVYILIDELDRCRPTYAIEVLETIKHFFNIPNFVFVVATDTKQLSHSIKAVYGAGFDGNEYLTRFFNRTATLPEPDPSLFIESILSKYKVKGVSLQDTIRKSNLFPDLDGDARSFNVLLSNYIAYIYKLYGFTLRRIEQLIAKFHSIIVYELEKNPKVIFDFYMVLTLLAEHSNPDLDEIYQKRKVEGGRESIEASHDDPINKFGQSMRLIKCLDYVSKARISKSHFEQDRFSYRFFNGFRNGASEISEYDLDVVGLLSNFEEISGTGDIRETRDVKMNYKNKLIRIKNMRENFPVWSRGDYFKAVELSDTLT